jgi:hypothetical protein
MVNAFNFMLQKYTFWQNEKENKIIKKTYYPAQRYN